MEDMETRIKRLKLKVLTTTDPEKKARLKRQLQAAERFDTFVRRLDAGSYEVR